MKLFEYFKYVDQLLLENRMEYIRFEDLFEIFDNLMTKVEKKTTNKT